MREHLLTIIGPQARTGSSPRRCGNGPVTRAIVLLPVHPRVRGTPALNAAAPTTSRFIPACGEHGRPQTCPTRRHRFIPAHAGNTRQRRQHVDTVSVHPRVRGTRPHGPRSGLHPGSSPRMRGTHHRGYNVDLAVTVHPRACGEHSRTRRSHLATAAVHPRACGEHADIGCQAVVAGSSPRMRGTRSA